MQLYENDLNSFCRFPDLHQCTLSLNAFITLENKIKVNEFI